MKRVAHISDLHFGRHSESAAEALLNSIEESQPDLIAISGDFTQRARTSEFVAARQFLDRIKQPKLLVPGNHDIPLYNLFNRFVRPLRNYDRHFASAGLPLSLYQDDEIAVLGIDTARRLTRKNGRVSLAQIDDATKVFGALPEEVLRIVVTHHPLASPEGATRAELAGRSLQAMAAFKQIGVRLLLSGHHHRAVSGGNVEVEAGGAVLVLHAGTAISTRTRGGEDNSYNLLDIGRDTVAVGVLEWQGGRFQEVRRTAYSFGGERWLGTPAGAALPQGR